MSRMQEINQRLSLLRLNGKRIVYLISEDRDILEEIFTKAAPTIKALAYESLQEICKTPNEMFYRFVLQNAYLADAYSMKEFSDKFGRMFYPSIYERKTVDLEEVSFLYLNDFDILSKDIAAHFLKQFLIYAKQREEEHHPIYLFLISTVLKIPEGFRQSMEIVDVPEMDREDLLELLSQEAMKETNEKEDLVWSPKEVCALDWDRVCKAAADFGGLPRKEIIEIIRCLQSAYGSFYGRSSTRSGTMENLEKIREERVRLVAMHKEENARYDKTVTILESQEAVSGLDGYMSWMDEVKEDMLHPESCRKWGCQPPKGVLLSGVPGSGKTQAAKLTASRMKVPLVQFRMDNLLGGLVGDSEANFKRCRKKIEALAPCVVLIDELEKLFGREESEGSHEVTMNLLAALLDWLQENKKAIFFFATSNHVKGLRPELLRDGRFDMRFYVFMPTYEELLSIFEYHLKKTNDMSQNTLFSRWEDQYQKLAGEFLERIAKYAREENKNMFYTGANVESLILQTNRSLRKHCMMQEKRGVSFEEYKRALYQTAISGKSQPYGMTNMEDIAKSWLEARKNQYAAAGKGNLFPFDRFYEGNERAEKETERKPRFFITPHTENGYDQLLFERISKEICQIQERRNQLERN